MNYKIIIATCGFGVFFIIGLIHIVGTLLQWKSLIKFKERQWLFSVQYLDRKVFGKSVVIIGNLLRGLILISVSLAGLPRSHPREVQEDTEIFASLLHLPFFEHDSGRNIYGSSVNLSDSQSSRWLPVINPVAFFPHMQDYFWD